MSSNALVDILSVPWFAEGSLLFAVVYNVWQKTFQLIAILFILYQLWLVHMRGMLKTCSNTKNVKRDMSQESWGDEEHLSLCCWSKFQVLCSVVQQYHNLALSYRITYRSILQQLQAWIIRLQFRGRAVYFIMLVFFWLCWFMSIKF